MHLLQPLRLIWFSIIHCSFRPIKLVYPTDPVRAGYLETMVCVLIDVRARERHEARLYVNLAEPETYRDEDFHEARTSQLRVAHCSAVCEPEHCPSVRHMSQHLTRRLLKKVVQESCHLILLNDGIRTIIGDRIGQYYLSSTIRQKPMGMHRASRQRVN